MYLFLYLLTHLFIYVSWLQTLFFYYYTVNQLIIDTSAIMYTTKKVNSSLTLAQF